MSKHTVKLTLVEMYAVKHALQNQVNKKSERYEQEINKEKPDQQFLEKLNKDIGHERALAARIGREILEYRSTKKIGG